MPQKCIDITYVYIHNFDGYSNAITYKLVHMSYQYIPYIPFGCYGTTFLDNNPIVMRHITAVL